MESKVTNIILITGPPGVGKTTLVRKICTELTQKCNIFCQGFYTQEVRAHVSTGPRIGFDIVTLAGESGILARAQPRDGIRRPFVGKYSVYVQDFENIALPLLQGKDEAQLLVLDEVGKMELKSKAFEIAVNKLVMQQRTMLVTIPDRTFAPLKLVECLKSISHSKLYELTIANRDQLTEEILEYVKKLLIK